MFNFRKKYKLSDLTNLQDGISTDRSKFKIAVIEDKVFPYLEELRRHDFNITIFEDIERLSILSDFQIVVSDIRGVGKFFGSKLEGAHLIEEIHKKYPNVYLIAYSSSTFNPSYNEFLKLCDETKKKSIDVNEWTKTFDRALKKVADPIYQWEKTRRILLKNSVNIDTISKLEKLYAKSIIKKDKSIFNKEIISSKSGKSEHLKTILDSISIFAATFISNFLKPE